MGVPDGLSVGFVVGDDVDGVAVGFDVVGVSEGFDVVGLKDGASLGDMVGGGGQRPQSFGQVSSITWPITPVSAHRFEPSPSH